MNTIILSGNIANTPELKKTKTDKDVLSLRIGNNDKKDSTLWIDVYVWDAYGEALSHQLDKGMKVVVEGDLTVQDYEGRDGQKRTRAYITARKVEFTPKKTEEKSDLTEWDEGLPF